MKTEIGKPLSKSEMKKIMGGKYPGCAAYGQDGEAYSQGCCAGLSECPDGYPYKCELPSDPCFNVGPVS